MSDDIRDHRVKITGAEHIVGQEPKSDQMGKVGLVVVPRLDGAIMQSSMRQPSPNMLFVLSWPDDVSPEQIIGEDGEPVGEDFSLKNYVRMDILTQETQEVIRKEIGLSKKKSKLIT